MVTIHLSLPRHLFWTSMQYFVSKMKTLVPALKFYWLAHIWSRDWKTNVVLQGGFLFSQKHPLLLRMNNLDLKVSPRKPDKIFYNFINLPPCFSNYLGQLHENMCFDLAIHFLNNHDSVVKRPSFLSLAPWGWFWWTVIDVKVRASSCLKKGHLMLCNNFKFDYLISS